MNCTYSRMFLIISCLILFQGLASAQQLIEVDEGDWQSEPYIQEYDDLTISTDQIPIMARDGRRDGGDEGEGTRTRTRKGECSLGAEFGLRVMPPRPNGNLQDILFTILKPGLRVDSNGHLLVKANNVSIAPYPGTLSFVFYNGPAGTNEFHQRSQLITSDADLRTFMAQPPPRMNAPAAIAFNNTPLTERLRAVVDYDPSDIEDDCDPISSELTVTWNFNGAPIAFNWQAMEQLQASIKIPDSRSRVSVAPDIIDETTGFPGNVNKATHTTVVFKVDDPFACCGQANTDYAIVQFVRHRWQLGNGRPRADDWNLDGPESQSERHASGADFDPTYTNDPAHGADTAGSGNDLVHVGPWDGKGGGAISVDDYPGLLEADHNRFMAQGGWMEWEFITLLICKEGTGSAQHYIDNGKVCAKTRFTVRRNYPGQGRAPVVKGSLAKGGREGKPEYYAQCRELGAVLDELELKDEFLNPRSHRVRLQ